MLVAVIILSLVYQEWEVTKNHLVKHNGWCLSLSKASSHAPVTLALCDPDQPKQVRRGVVRGNTAKELDRGGGDLSC